MDARVQYENFEKSYLSKYATLSSNSKGRKILEEKCNVRTDFQRDRDRLIHSKSFRRLKHKTQVFIAPEGDHFRTRLTHTLEVSQIARTIARALRLNEDLTEAICLGHDLGHTPFGHTGERILNVLHSNGFKHYEQSIRVIDFLEYHNGKKGLNLTHEVREGIIKHSGGNKSLTLEGQIVKFADRIAYINHDIDDAIRANIINAAHLPERSLKILGKSHGQRINTMIVDLIENSRDKDTISMSEDIGEETESLREFMFEYVYLNKNAKSEEDKAEHVITAIYNYYLENMDRLPIDHLKIYDDIPANNEDIVCDYIAGMTDRYVVNIFTKIFVPKPLKII